MGDIVERLERLVNSGDVDGTVELFHPDAVITIPALSPRRGADEIRELFEFCAGIGLRWEVKESTSTDTGASCRVDQFDGWASLIGLAPLRYEQFDIAIDDGRITSIDGKWGHATLTALGTSLEGFTPWATERHPELYGPDGDFRYTREAGAGFVLAAREWLESG